MQLMKVVQENPEMDEQRIVALFSMKTGLKTETINGYLKEIKDAFGIEQISELKAK